MATQTEYALMAGAAYISTRPLDANKFPTPQGWTMSRHDSRDSGFEAVTFTNGSEYVISFAGTYDKSPADLIADAELGAESKESKGSASHLNSKDHAASPTH